MKNYRDLLRQFHKGERQALARAISLVENEDVRAGDFLDAVFPNVGRAYRVGITGPPGAGKSTLVDGLVKHLRRQNRTVGVIAVDPTSPFSGGALLGDRIRMQDISLDEGVFIRSVATRGSLGGLSHRASDIADLLDAFGKDLVFFETVGVGQSELDVVQAADTVIVVLVPESGDGIQAMKAGLMEIADFFVLNKADRAGADSAILEIESMLHLREKRDWQPGVVRAAASQGQGIDEVAGAIADHREFLEQTGLLQTKRHARMARKIESIVRAELEKEFWDEATCRRLEQVLKGSGDLKQSPHKVAAKLLDDFKNRMEKRANHGTKD